MASSFWHILQNIPAALTLYNAGISMMLVENNYQ